MVCTRYLVATVASPRVIDRHALIPAIFPTTVTVCPGRRCAIVSCERTMTRALVPISATSTSHCPFSRRGSDATTPAHPKNARTYLHNFFPCRNNTGDVIGISCVVQDVTDAKANLGKALGDVRELQEALERSLLLSPSRELLGGEAAICLNLQEIEEQRIRAALAKTKWKIKGSEGAASLLGMKPNTLWARMKKLGIERP